ncbi:FecR domain-containing protein [Stratiformator vulcanicus]|uniref:FecR protein n=1 Tax=Stratiformator vulcanicus TaxID=2527980 RepID=A0A517R5R5_9PLAN|nr:FecR domain-containing protein [Stratiformator vulcanicus]QDT39246.1 FecR protein [Stratiformator vulcanicus]
MNSEFHRLLDKLCDERITPGERYKLEQMLSSSAELRAVYLDYVDLHSTLGDLAPAEVLPEPLVDSEFAVSPTPARKRPASRLGFVAAVAALSLGFGYLLPHPGFLQRDRQVESTGEQPTEVPEGIGQANTAEVIAHAAASFGGRSDRLAVGDTLEPLHEYVLTGGLLSLRFASGAEAILTGPAVFRIGGSEDLALDLGGCSLHAPDGAEGFTIRTPRGNVVDLGTRFSVDVAENGEADLTVIEGAASIAVEEMLVSEADNATGNQSVVLREGEAMRLPIADKKTPTPIPFNAERYVTALPDRVLSYVADVDAEGHARRLESVDVQRDGRVLRYVTDRLIAAEVDHYAFGDDRITNAGQVGVVVTPTSDPESKLMEGASRRRLIGRPFDLATGVINPGGIRADVEGKLPSLGDAPLGLGVRFEIPVVNGPGPDVVLFDLHVVSHAVGGDTLLVRNWSASADRERSLRIDRFDIDATHPAAEYLTDFRLHWATRPMRSIAQLSNAELVAGPQHAVRAQILAVGIDLSDLGVPAGGSVDRLLIQDDLEVEDFVDPVVVVGLPEDSALR